METVFAPEERDVYSYERVPNDVAPLGAKAGRRTLAKESVALLRMLEEQKKDRQAINLSPLWGEAMGRLHFEVELAKVKSGCERTNPRFGCLLFAVCCLPTED